MLQVLPQDVFNALLEHIVQESPLTAKQCHSLVQMASILRLAPQLATPVQMVITVTKMVYFKPVLVVQFANGQILLFLLCLDNVAQATIAMLTMNLRVQLDLGLPQDQVYARQSFLDKCGSQQTISLSHVHGDITNHIMQLKTHVRIALLVLLAVIQLRNPLNAPQALLPLL